MANFSINKAILVICITVAIYAFFLIWSDAGKVDDMRNISTFVQSVEKVENIKIACLEEIALSKKWINKKKILKNIKFYGNCEYSNYLKKL